MTEMKNGCSLGVKRKLGDLILSNLILPRPLFFLFSFAVLLGSDDGELHGASSILLSPHTTTYFYFYFLII